MAETMNPIDAAKYLAKYGYLGDIRMADARVEMLADGEALGEFQAFAGLPVTGLLDAETVAQMQKPRCGVSDARALGGSPLPAKWQKRNLKYFIKTFVDGIHPIQQTDRIMRKFDAWSAVANIKFQLVAQQQGADIIISAGRGPASGFDGPGKVLAYAYLPTGDDRQLLMMYDLDENWEPIFDATSLHEFGHLQGLDHSRDQDDVMAPFLNASFVVPRRGDITRIQALYGPPVVGPDPDPTPGNTICDMVRECLKQFNTIRKAENFTMAGIQFDESDRQALNKLVEAATNPTCTKITELLAKIAAVCPAQALRRCDPEPAVGGGMCAGLTGILQLLPMLQELLKMCKPTA